jgi:hypothetical protein
MKSIRLLGLLTFGLTLPASLFAQSSAIEQFQRTQSAPALPKPQILNLSTNKEAPELYPGENTDVGPQHILRLLKRKTYFEVVADSQYLYTDNPFLSDANKTPTSLFVNTVQAAFAPEPIWLDKAQLAYAIGFRSQWFNYDLDGYGQGLNRLDFNAQTAFLNARYQRGAWQLYGGIDFTRLVDQGSYVEAYREYSPTLGCQRFFQINEHFTVIAGVQFSAHSSEVPLQNLPSQEVNDRFDGALNLSCSYEIAPRLFVQPYYRFQYTWYPGFANPLSTVVTRNDTLNTFGTAFIYYFTQNIGARLFLNYEMKAADYSQTYSYHKFDAGGGLSLNFRF